MERWNENPFSVVKEYPFDFEQYIEERLREISDLDERRYAKKVLLEGMGKAIRLSEARYQELEQRILEEVERDSNTYETAMTVIQKTDYDPTNETLFPVCDEDRKEKEQQKILSSDGMIWLGSIFLRGTEEEIRELAQAGPLKGAIVSGGREKMVSIFVNPARRYREAIEKLYQMFLDNDVPWETMNTAYLDRFFDVFVGEDSNVDSLEEVEIDFGHFTDKVQYNRMPLWNLKSQTFNSMDFMEPGIDGIYYEHQLLLKEDMTQDGYLIQKNADILEIRHEPGKIVLKSDKENYENWKAVCFVQKETVRSLHYSEPFLTNRKKESFVRRFAGRMGRRLMTKADLFRRIRELDIGVYLDVEDCRIQDRMEEYPDTGSMNWFLQDEVFPMDSRRILLISFKARSADYLNESMVRFAVSQLQTEISEYRLAGEIV